MPGLFSALPFLFASMKVGIAISLIGAVVGELSNNAGGILGGLSSGQPIVAHLALKPTSSITTPGRSIDIHGNPVDIITKGRHDPCVGIRATPIAEAMMAIVLMDHLLRHRAQNADVRVSTPVLPQL